MSDYTNLGGGVRVLRKLASERGVKGAHRLDKDALVAALDKLDAETEVDDRVVTAALAAIAPVIVETNYADVVTTVDYYGGQDPTVVVTTVGRGGPGKARPVKVTFTRTDGTTHVGNFTTVDRATKVMERGVERGRVSAWAFAAAS